VQRYRLHASLGEPIGVILGVADVSDDDLATRFEYSNCFGDRLPSIFASVNSQQTLPVAVLSSDGSRGVNRSAAAAAKPFRTEVRLPAP